MSASSTPRLYAIHDASNKPNLTLHEYGKRADDLMSTYTDGAHLEPTQHTTATIATPPTPTTGPPPLTHTQLQPPTPPPQPTP
ncbi:hypothetical protein Pcinc_009820 [Petrolisthes cinctipes]|uniref:Uncharacterized protein n=1 Tax=Petrolisthes cinctipes TaxID=88211 RepID=A0AAE1GA98_PETCI|nr:hypothetical protein Pcinc_009820 [Petrolisthes cinctipes]